MIVQGKIKSTLKKLEKKYSNALRSPDAYEAKLYAKLGLIEYCGWLEESLDRIAKRSVKNKLKDQNYLNMLNSIIKDNHGFRYKDHFRNMMRPILGLENLEKLGAFLDQGARSSILENEFESVWCKRCDAAHKSIHGATHNYDAPSVMLVKLNTVFPILRDTYLFVSKF